MNNFMIRLVSHKDNILSQSIYLKLVGNFDIHHTACPACGTEGELIFYGTYERTYFDFNGKPHTIKISRVYCKAWHHTHALIPVSLIPYKRFLFNMAKLCFKLGLSSFLSRFVEIDPRSAKRLYTYYDQHRPPVFCDPPVISCC